MGLNEHPPGPALTSLDDDQVMLRVQDNPATFEVLYNRYFEKIYRYCLKRTSDVQIAEDLCSEIFTTILEKRHQYKSGYFAAWLFRIAHNKVVDHYRKQKPVVAIDTMDVRGESHMARTVANQLLVAEILSELNDDERELIVLRLEAELTAPEIAARTGKTANAVRVQIYRLMQRLRARYNTMLEDES